MICNECETVAHCTKHGCIPKHQALDKMAENARELGLDYEQYENAIEVSVIFHKGQRMFAVPKQVAQQQEPDLSGLKPSTQEVIKRWIEDGTFIERAIGAMQEQEAENMRLEKMAAPQPTPVQEQEPLTDGYVQLVPDKCDRIVWRSRYYHLPPLPAQRTWVGLTDEEIEAMDCINALWDDGESCTIIGIKEFARKIEAKLKEKNT